MAVGERRGRFHLFAAYPQGEGGGVLHRLEGFDLLVDAAAAVPQRLQLGDGDLPVALELLHVPAEVCHHLVGHLYRAVQLPQDALTAGVELGLDIADELGQVTIAFGQDLALEGEEQCECELHERLPALEEEERPEPAEYADWELLREEGHEPADCVALRGEVVAFEVPMKCGEVVVDVEVEDVADLAHAFQVVVVVAQELQVAQEVGAEEVGLLLGEAELEHRPHHAVETLHVGEAVDLAAQFENHPPQVVAHGLHLLPASAEPDISAIDIHVDALPVAAAVPALPHPPLAQLPLPQDGVPHELLLLAHREDPLLLGNVADDRLRRLPGLAARSQRLVELDEVHEGEEVEHPQQLVGRKLGDDARVADEREEGQAGVPPSPRVERDEVPVNMMRLALDHIIRKTAQSAQ